VKKCSKKFIDGDKFILFVLLANINHALCNWINSSCIYWREKHGRAYICS